MKKGSQLSLVSKRSAQAPEAQKLDFKMLNRIVDRAFFIALQMIDIANHQRPTPERGEPKVGGHPSACASSQHILAAIHLVLRSPEDYFAHKPHISPMDHAFNYLLGNFWEADGSRMPLDRAQIAMKNLRHYSAEEPVFQSYHAEADPDSFRYFPSGSVGIPPVNALYFSLAYQFAKDHGFDLDEDPTFWCLMGDSEFREGSLAEAMPDAGDRQLNNLVWIVDYNRQNLDGTRILNEEAFNGSDADRIVRVAEANGWNAIKLKHGKIREDLFSKPGGDEFKRVLDEELTDFEFQSVLAANNAGLTKKVLTEKSPKMAKWIKEMGEEYVHEAFLNLGGHDMASLIEVLGKAKAEKTKPTLVVAYTIKGKGLNCAALSGNHSALPEADELKSFAERIGASVSNPFELFPDDSAEGKYLIQRNKTLVSGIGEIKKTVAARQQAFLEFANEIKWPKEFEIGALKFNPVAHTQWMWGQIAAKVDRLARGEGASDSKNAGDVEWAKVAKYFLTMAPDVGSSTNTSPNMNGKLYGDIGQDDFEKRYDVKDEKAPDIVPHTNARTGHIRFEIAEGNCMSAAGSFGKAFHFTGIPFYPAMTIYDFFIKRAHDQLYYNLYWHSKFATIGTPSGITLAPEGAQHSWKSDFQIPNCVTWEPCFAKELEWIMADMLRRHFTRDDVGRESVLIRCMTKGQVQKDLSDRLGKQKRFEGKSEAEIFSEIREDVLKGGYTLIDYRGYEDYVPGDNVIQIFAMGALVAEAIKASDRLSEQGIRANVHVVTSPDLLLSNFAHNEGYDHLKNRLEISGDLYVRRDREVNSKAGWLALQSSRVPVLSIHDGEPGLLDNIGSIVGVKQHTLAVRKTSKSGTTADIFHYHGLDAQSIVEAAIRTLKETAYEKFSVNSEVLS